MSVVLGVLGVYMVLMGGLLCVKPPAVTRMGDWLLNGPVGRVVAALVTLGIGMLIFWAVPASRAPLFVQILGGLTILKGLHILLAPRAHLARIITWWKGLSPKAYCMWGLLTAAIGVALLATL